MSSPTASPVLVTSSDERGPANRVPVDTVRWTDLAADALRAEGITGRTELHLTFVDVDAITALNAQFMGKDSSTDVLSFPLEGPDEAHSSAHDADAETGPPRLLGDIVICPDIAARNAPDHAGQLDDELALLVVHGVLHILGHDHIELGDARLMHTRERALLDLLYGPVVVPEHGET